MIDQRKITILTQVFTVYDLNLVFHVSWRKLYRACSSKQRFLEVEYLIIHRWKKGNNIVEERSNDHIHIWSRICIHNCIHTWLYSQNNFSFDELSDDLLFYFFLQTWHFVPLWDTPFITILEVRKEEIFCDEEMKREEAKTMWSKRIILKIIGSKYNGVNRTTYNRRTVRQNGSVTDVCPQSDYISSSYNSQVENF